jgi:hypothetical protein
MEHSISWKANRFSSSQEIYLIVLNRKVHYHTHNSQWLTHILNQSKAVYARHPTFHLHVDFPSGLYTSGFPTKILYVPLLSAVEGSFM